MRVSRFTADSSRSPPQRSRDCHAPVTGDVRRRPMVHEWYEPEDSVRAGHRRARLACAIRCDISTSPGLTSDASPRRRAQPAPTAPRRSRHSSHLPPSVRGCPSTVKGASSRHLIVSRATAWDEKLRSRFSIQAPGGYHTGRAADQASGQPSGRLN